MKTCGECAHGRFQRTPTGRFKGDTAGRCDMQDVIRTECEAAMSNIPCVDAGRAHIPIISVWPEFEADQCKHWKHWKAKE